MVSEPSFAAAHGGDLGGVTRSRDRESIYTDGGRSGRSSTPSSFDGGSGDGISKNQQSERQFDGISGRWSFLEEAGFKNQQAGSRSHGNHWRGAAMQVDDGKIVGRQLFDEMPKRQVSNHNFSAKSSSLRLHDRQVFDEIPKRSQPHWDEEARMHATRDLLKCVIDHRIAVKSRPSCVRGAVIDECNRVEQWLIEKSQQQDAVPTNVEPMLWSHEIRMKTRALGARCKHIMKVALSSPTAQTQILSEGSESKLPDGDVSVFDECEGAEDDNDEEDVEYKVFEEGFRQNADEEKQLIESTTNWDGNEASIITEIAHHYGAKQDKLIAVSPTEPTVILSNTELPNNPPTPRCVSTTSVSFECWRGCELGEPKPPILECLYCWKENNIGVEKSEGVEGLVCHAGGITQGRSEESVICTSGSSIKEKNALVFDLGGNSHDVPFCNSLSQCQTRVSGTTLVDDELESFGVEMNGQRCFPGQIDAQVLISVNEPAEEKDVCELVKISGSSFYVLFPAQFSDGLQTKNSKSKQARKYNFLALVLGIKELSSYINRRKFYNSPKYLETMRKVVELELRELLLADEEGGHTFDPGGGVVIVEAQLDNIAAIHILRFIEWIEEVISDTQAAAIITPSVFHIICLMFVRKLHSSIYALQNWKFLIKRAEILGFSITINTFFIRSKFGIALKKKSLQNFLFCIDEVSLEADLIREAVSRSILSISDQYQYVLLLIPSVQVVQLDSDIDYERSLKQLAGPVKGATRKLPRPVTAEPMKIDNGVYGRGKSTWHQPLPCKDHAQIIVSDHRKGEDGEFDPPFN